MTVSLANEVRAVGTPVYCSACFNQDSSKTHIDFDASCDRGYGNGPLPIQMDDLVLCETCVRSGARLLGMVDEDVDRIADLERRARYERDRADKAEQYADQLEGAMHVRPEPIHVAKKRGRPVKAREDEES